MGIQYTNYYSKDNIDLVTILQLYQVTDVKSLIQHYIHKKLCVHQINNKTTTTTTTEPT